MIKVNGGEVDVCGHFTEIQAEFTVLTKSLLEHGFDKDDIKECVEMASLTQEQLAEKTKKLMESLSANSEAMESFLKELLSLD